MSFIYDSVPMNEREELGYFEPKVPSMQRISRVDFITGNTLKLLDRHARILYYPGSFGVFHAGHIHVVNEAIEGCRRRGEEYILVIAPSNSDYNVDKYGAWTKLSSNKHRLESIQAAFPEAIIDLNPMLNHVCDHNFTDCLKEFVLSIGRQLESLWEKPIILCGKDRQNFVRLMEYTDLVKVQYVSELPGQSTSGLVEQNPEQFNIKKKDLYLRCNTYGEYLLFKEYFSDQYTRIMHMDILSEKYTAIQTAKRHGITHTICKDYADFLTYIPVSRQWLNPIQTTGLLSGLDELMRHVSYGGSVLDSDVYTGGTKKALKTLGINLVPVYDFTNESEYSELLDIDDFKKPLFQYPYVDISSRCSMQAFTKEFHDKYTEFRARLSQI